MIISALHTLSSGLQEKVLVKFFLHHHAPMKVTFADNQDKFDYRTTSVLYILNDWLLR